MIALPFFDSDFSHAKPSADFSAGGRRFRSVLVKPSEREMIYSASETVAMSRSVAVLNT